MRQVIVVVIDEVGERATQRVLDALRETSGVVGVGEAGSQPTPESLRDAHEAAVAEADEAEAEARYDARERRMLDSMEEKD